MTKAASGRGELSRIIYLAVFAALMAGEYFEALLAVSAVYFLFFYEEEIK